MAGPDEADRKSVKHQITTLYTHIEQKSITEHASPSSQQALISVYTDVVFVSFLTV